MGSNCSAEELLSVQVIIAYGWLGGEKSCSLVCLHEYCIHLYHRPDGKS